MNKAKLTISNLYENNNKSWIILAFIFFLLGLSLLILSDTANGNDWIFHKIFCVISTVIIFKQFFKLFNRSKIALLIDLRWILVISFWFYYVLGASLLVSSRQDLIDNAMRYYPVDLNLVLKVDAMNALGLSIILAIVSMYKVKWPSKIIGAFSREIRFFDPMGHRSLIFLLLFCIYSLIYINLHRIGYVDKGILHGIAQNFKFLGLSFALIIFYYNGKYQKTIKILSFFYLVTYTFLGMLYTSKAEILAPITFLLFVYSIKKNSYKLTAICFLFIFFMLQVLGNYTSAIRSQDEKSSIQLDLLKSNLNISEEQNTYQIWNRINYVNSQGAAINFYDNGDGGKSLSKIFWLFVPRFLNKDKPDVSGFAGVFFKKIRDHGGSRDSPGIFVEGYYNYGWIGMITSSVLAGLVIKFYSVMIARIFLDRIYLLYFIIFSGLWTTFRIDGLIITDYLGLFVLLLYFIIFSAFFLSLIRVSLER